MTEHGILSWINTNLGPHIDQALIDAKKKNPDLIYTRDWLGAMANRETGFLIARYVQQGIKVEIIHSLMRGDYKKRPSDKEKCYHGFGYWQIDIGSFPEFVKSGDWKDPFKTCRKAIAVLEDKRLYLAPKFPNLQGDGLNRAITAAYNCGEGNVRHVIEAGQDVDARTYDHKYSAEVWRFREIFKTL